MKGFFRKAGFFPLLCCFFTLFSCASNISGSLKADGSAQVSVGTALEPVISAMIQKFLDAGKQEGYILNGEAISRSMSAAPGIASAVLRNTGSSALEGQVNISRIGAFLAAADGKGFFNFEQGAGGGFCEISITRDNSAEIIKLLSPEIESFLTILMAPIVWDSGDNWSKAEYLKEVSDFYGDSAVGDEIANSVIRAAIDFPGSITSIKGGTFSSKRANFEIPLVDLLVLETPLVYEVRWR